MALTGSIESYTTLTRSFACLLVALLVQAGADCLLSQSENSHAGLQYLVAQENTSQPPTTSARTIEDTRPKKDVPAITQRFYEEMTKFNSIMSPEEEEGEDAEVDPLAPDTRDLTKAQKILDGLLSSDWLNDNERAQVHQSYAWLAQDMEKPRLAIEHLSKTLDFRDGITYAQEERALDGLSRLHYLLRDYQIALKYALQFVDLALSLNASQCSYIAQVYRGLNDSQNARVWTQKAKDKKEE